MRENRTYGSEGGEAKKPSLPLSISIGAVPLRNKPLQQVMNDAAQQIELVPRHRQRLRTGDRLLRGVGDGRRVCRRALQRRFRRREAERDRRDAAGGDADELEGAGRNDGAGANFDQRPLRMTAADGALVECALILEWRWKLDRPDHFA